MVCPLGQGELSQCGHFRTKEEWGSTFAILYGRPLWTASKTYLEIRRKIERHETEEIRSRKNLPPS